MKKTCLSVLLGIACLIPSLAQAQAYAGLSVGRAKATQDALDVFSAGTAYKINGGYRLSENWGVEGGYANFGRGNTAVQIGGTNVTADMKTSGLYAAATGTVPLGEDFSVFAKLGYGWYRASVDVRIAGVASSLSGSSTGSGAMYGLGAQYSITKNISAVLEYEEFLVSDSVKQRAWTLGARYKF